MVFLKIYPVVFAYICAFFVIYSVHNVSLLYLMIIFGQAHFIISYLYTYRAGKMNSFYQKRALMFFLVFFTVSSFIYFHQEYLPFFVLGTLLTFVYHYAYDEVKLSLGKEWTSNHHPFFFCFSLLSFFTPIFIDKIFHVAIPVHLFFTVGFISLLYFFNSLRRGATDYHLAFKSFSLILFTFINSIFVLVLAYKGFSERFSLYAVAAVIIFYHYVRWYVYYGLLFQDDDFNIYLDIIIWVHILLFLLFFQYYLSPGTGVLFTFFSQTYFYGWTMIHILLSSDILFIKKKFNK